MDQNQAGGAAADPFQARSYIQWVRELVTAMAARPDAVGLFDASMPEPSLLLKDAIGEVLETPGRPRLRSVMDFGNPLVIQALCARYGVGGDQVLCTSGALSGVAMTLRALVGPGGHMLMERPYLDTLLEVAQGVGAEIGFLERTGPEARLDLVQARARLRPDTRLILLTNLHNPTGAYLEEADLLALAALVEGGPTRIVVDEVYADFVHRLAGRGRAAANLGDAFVSINSLSKVYGLSVLKCGWIVGDRETIARIAAVHAREEFGISKLTHAAASLVLEREAAFIDFAQAVLAEAAPVVRSWAAEMIADGLIEGDVPARGCLYFPRLVGVEDTRAFAARLWREHAVAVAPGELFQSPGHVRLGFGRSPDVLRAALGRLAETLRAIRQERRTTAMATAR